MLKIFNVPKIAFGFLTVSSLGIFSTSSLAIEGFYVGAGANYNWLDADYSAHNYIVDPFFGRNDVGNGSGDLSGNDPGGQVVAGYTWAWSCTCPCDCSKYRNFFVSLEGFAEFYSVKSKGYWESPQVTLTLNQSLETKLKNGFGVNLKPGLMLTDKISVFGLVGYVYSQLDITYDTDLTLYNNEGVSDFKKKGLNGLRLGLGTQYYITENIVAELSWIVNFYQNYEHHNEYVTGQEDGSIYYEKVKMDSIRNNQLFLNFNYYFN